LASFPVLADRTRVPLWSLRKKKDTELSQILYTEIRDPLQQSFKLMDENNDFIFRVKQRRAKKTVTLLSDFCNTESPDW
jgi:hypothetical protein